MLLSLICAVATTLTYGISAVLQAAAARGGAAGPLDARTLTRLTLQPLYLLGLSLDIVAFVLSVVALRELPLFFVQSAVTAAMGVTAVGSVLFLGARLTGTEVVALIVLAFGLVSLGLSSSPAPALHVSALTRTLLLLGPGVVIALGSLAVHHRRPIPEGTWAAVGAGMCFVGVGVTGRLLHTGSLREVITDPAAAVLAAYGVFGAATFAAGLARMSVTRVLAISSAIETVVPATIGIVMLGDRARAGLSWLAVVGFALSIGAAVAIAGRTPVRGRAHT